MQRESGWSVRGNGLVPVIKQKMDEFDMLLEILISRNVKKILEIGTFNGLSARMMAEATNGMVVTVDPNCMKFENPKIISICGYSQNQNVIDKVSLHAPFDFIFIDGDHRRSLEDFDIYRQFLNSSGMIGFHDINPNCNFATCPVVPVWNNFKKSYHCQEIISKSDLKSGYGIGIIYL